MNEKMTAFQVLTEEEMFAVDGGMIAGQDCTGGPWWPWWPPYGPQYLL
jgi:hypothetical protein